MPAIETSLQEGCRLRACSFIEKGTQSQVFSYDFCKNFHSSFFYRTYPVDWFCFTKSEYLASTSSEMFGKIVFLKPQKLWTFFGTVIHGQVLPTGFCPSKVL